MSSRLTTEFPSLVGADLQVPLATGGSRHYVNLDFAASTPALEVVAQAVAEALPWYSSVHRGAGYASQVSTAMFESAREIIGEFVGARPEDVVIFVRNTTEGLNVLAHTLKFEPGDVVITTEAEHHANLLPWRRVAEVRHLPIAASAEQVVSDLADAISAANLNRGRRVKVVAVSGASNVTGEILPLAELGALAHAAGALLVVDAAQLAPHRPIDMAGMGIDCLALSGHKMYAPYGSGVLVAPRSALQGCEPFLAGGGAVDFVGLNDVSWAALPGRLEAGSPNVLGAIALGVAARTLQAVGMDRLAEHERELLTHAETLLADTRGLQAHRMWPVGEGDRLGICTFSVEGMHHAHVAAVLSAEHAIGVRHGCFCAHPLMTHLLTIDEPAAARARDSIRRAERQEIPGAVRASFGIGTSTSDIDQLFTALRSLIANGPALTYKQDVSTGDFHPVDDLRELPRLTHIDLRSAVDDRGGCGQF